MSLPIVILGVIVLIGIVLIAIYNGLVAKRQTCREAFAGIDVQLKQRQNLIPNLVETVKGVCEPRAGNAGPGHRGAQLRSECAWSC